MLSVDQLLAAFIIKSPEWKAHRELRYFAGNKMAKLFGLSSSDQAVFLIEVGEREVRQITKEIPSSVFISYYEGKLLQQFWVVSAPGVDNKLDFLASINDFSIDFNTYQTLVNAPKMTSFGRAALIRAQKYFKLTMEEFLYRGYWRKLNESDLSQLLHRCKDIRFFRQIAIEYGIQKTWEILGEQIPEIWRKETAFHNIHLRFFIKPEMVESLKKGNQLETLVFYDYKDSQAFSGLCNLLRFYDNPLNIELHINPIGSSCNFTRYLRALGKIFTTPNLCPVQSVKIVEGIFTSEEGVSFLRKLFVCEIPSIIFDQSLIDPTLKDEFSYDSRIQLPK